ncbi:MAG: cation diffusion facilitator family transporter [Wolbachia endosymbiont of Menacanthus eurysternus]|nr:MAG: cation diffusion facilitator family transporter [Wolbachia endosymbiont of Menacanthus eurysternus]
MVRNKKYLVMAESKYLIYSIIIVIVTMLTEVIGGIVSHSLTLLLDAGHMLTDFFVLLLSLIAHTFSSKKSDLQRSYGYHRLQIIAAFVNGLILFFIVAIIMIESIKRFVFPKINIEWQIMLIVAIFGLIANVIIFFLLHSKCRSNINIRSVILHVTGDILSSLVAIFASVVIMFTGWQIVDPLLSIFVNLILLNSVYKILKNSCHILLEGTPKGISVDKIKNEIIFKLPEVMDVHHVHVWSLSDNYFIITMHARIRQSVQHTDILFGIKKILLDKFRISHSTVEIEYGECVDNKVLNVKI